MLKGLNVSQEQKGEKVSLILLSSEESGVLTGLFTVLTKSVKSVTFSLSDFNVINVSFSILIGGERCF